MYVNGENARIIVSWPGDMQIFLRYLTEWVQYSTSKSQSFHLKNEDEMLKDNRPKYADSSK